jgi:hypothetical protein
MQLWHAWQYQEGAVIFWHDSSPGKPSCPSSSLLLFLPYLISSLGTSKFLVFTQAICRGPFWGPIWAMSPKLLYLLDCLQYSVHDHCHPRKLLRGGARAALPHKSWVQLPSMVVQIFQILLIGSGPDLAVSTGRGKLLSRSLPVGCLGGSEFLLPHRGVVRLQKM